MQQSVKTVSAAIVSLAGATFSGCASSTESDSVTPASKPMVDVPDRDIPPAYLVPSPDEQGGMRITVPPAPRS